MKEKQEFSLNRIFDYRAEIFGLSALMIVYHHLGNRGFPGIDLLPGFIANTITFVLSKAYLGVDVFVFLSAIGLCSSMSRNSVKDFYVHRLLRVGITWILIMTPVFVYEDILNSQGGVAGFLLDVSTLRYWVDHSHYNTPWFVPFIMALYLIFPLVYKLDIKTKHISTVAFFLLSTGFVIFSQFYTTAFYTDFTFPLSRLPIFFFGVSIYKYIIDGAEIKKSLMYVFTAIVLALYIMWSFLDLEDGLDKLCASVIAFGFVMIYSCFRCAINITWITKALAFIGAVSLEMYLIHHGVILRAIDGYNVPNLLFASMYILLPLISLALSMVYSYLSKKLQALILKNSKQIETSKAE